MKQNTLYKFLARKKLSNERKMMAYEVILSLETNKTYLKIINKDRMESLDLVYDEAKNEK